jgi:hypothetical protein
MNGSLNIIAKMLPFVVVVLFVLSRRSDFVCEILLKWKFLICFGLALSFVFLPPVNQFNINIRDSYIQKKKEFAIANQPFSSLRVVSSLLPEIICLFNKWVHKK